ncbi:heat-shock protein Hsp90 [Dialister invisus]|uniref:heat-shock protein Hsp90 n=1 Tax=Dialister invisus TaxID=218538 RepID=UPI0026756C56|nr:heat-shock protein Hsp90 [Dialister invisus]
MMNEAIVEKVKALITAPSCYAGLKKIAEEYIAALGSDREKEAGRKLVAELEADVLSIDDVLAFFESDSGEKTFGAEQAAAYAAHAREVKAKGGKWCDCPACVPGREILDRKEELC